jgi:quercetin dioxygenase-like cupin family protein
MASEAAMLDDNWERTVPGASLFANGSCVIRPDDIAWTQASLRGNWFKLLHIDRATGLWVALMKVDPNTTTEVHHHFGEVHALVLDGDFSYEYGGINNGDYIVEGGTIAHEPSIGPNGLTIVATFFGGLSGVGDDNKPLGPFVDAQWMYEAAAANNAADHLEPPAHTR